MFYDISVIVYIVPLLRSSAEHIIILEKQSVNLECIPTPNHLTITWNFNRLHNGPIELSEFAFSPLNHTLTIYNARLNYGGDYVCQILDFQINRTITLKILPGCVSI